ncbi:sterol desaturase family protein [Thiothrix nivea]|uniref:Fatty acid hydroxylase n=1 Tax=Thiothrix nivea (strain ATCC 35100 / DSM 5205 / JP2) TaxID=870187 RepID=A0A656HJQ0_THINJ|nr:sterol desaturase family protein [Thiothrix nivea]EIJ36304.1 fatty acid hydroxylase [Thiothrix nivea DSM 5205]
MNIVLLSVLLVVTWLLAAYFIHRVAHIKHKWNILFYIHKAHHEINYLASDEQNSAFKMRYLLFLFGDYRGTLDVLLTLTLPALLVLFVHTEIGLGILIFHYIYEVFLSEHVLDHNPRIRKCGARCFAWGEYHLMHHLKPSCNFGIILPIGDYLFGTYKKPAFNQSLTSINGYYSHELSK